MRVLLSTYGGRGDVEPLVAFAVRLRGRGVQVRVCAPPDEDFVRRLDAVGVPLVPFGPSARALATGRLPPTKSPATSRGGDGGPALGRSGRGSARGASCGSRRVRRPGGDRRASGGERGPVGGREAGHPLD